MEKKNKINEDDEDGKDGKIALLVTPKVLKDVVKTKELSDIQKANPEGVKLVYDEEGGSDSTSMLSISEEESIIEPQDQATIKYLSNVIDKESGEVSKPFTIDNKKYKMVRGQHPTKGVVLGVYCFDELNKDGNNIIHLVEYFEESVIKPIMDRDGIQKPMDNNSEDLMGHFNLDDLGKCRLFFIEKGTGKVIARFRDVKELATSGIKLGDNEMLVNRRQLKAIRFSSKIKEQLSTHGLDESVINTDKLTSDVGKLVRGMISKFGNVFAKLDKDIEKATFLSKIAELLKIDTTMLSALVSKFKDTANSSGNNVTPSVPTDGTTDGTTDVTSGIKESKRNVIKTIKIKDLKK